MAAKDKKNVAVKGQQKKKKKKLNWQWRVLSIALLFASLAFMPTTILLAIGMIPSLVAFYVDKTKKKTIAICVGSMNACGNVPFLMKLWTTEHNLNTTMQMVTEPLTVIVMWSTALVGWVLYDYVPAIYASSIRSKGERRLQQIRAEQKTLIGNWGNHVSGDGSAPSQASLAQTSQVKESEELLKD